MTKLLYKLDRIKLHAMLTLFLGDSYDEFSPLTDTKKGTLGLVLFTFGLHSAGYFQYTTG